MDALEAPQRAAVRNGTADYVPISVARVPQLIAIGRHLQGPQRRHAIGRCGPQGSVKVFGSVDPIGNPGGFCLGHTDILLGHPSGASFWSALVQLIRSDRRMQTRLHNPFLLLVFCRLIPLSQAIPPEDHHEHDPAF